MNVETPFLDVPAFLRVVELKSFTRAADALGTSQSAVSQAVSRLEKRLGVLLLRRTTRSLSLTAEGERFFARSRDLLLELQDAEAELTMQQATPRGPVRMTAPGAYGRIVLSAALGRFMLRYPQIELEMQLGDRPVDLVEEGFDLAVRLGELADSSLVARQIGVVPIGYFASRAWLRRHGVPQTPDDLRPEHTLVFTRPTGEVYPLKFRGRDGRPMQRTIRSPHRFGDAEVRCEMAAQGVGVAILHTFVVKQALQQKRLVPILQDWWPAPTPVLCLRPPGRLVPQRTRLLITELEGVCGAPG